MTNLNNAPPIRSDWRLGEYDAFVADCAARSAAAKDAWLAMRADAGLTVWGRAARVVRRVIGRV